LTAAVVVELPPAEGASADIPALLESCNVAMRQKAVCRLSQDQRAGDQSAAVAIVAWDGPTRARVRIDVGLQAGESAQWRSRELSFSAADPEIERFRTVGFAIATLVGDLSKRSGSDSNEAAPMPQAPAAMAGELRPIRPLAPAPVWWFDGQFLMQAVGEKAPAYGGQVRVSRMLGDGPWFVAGSAHLSLQSIAATSAQLSLERPGISAGGGLIALRLGASVAFALRVEPMLELLEVTARDAASGASDRGSHVTFGLKEGADASWSWSRNIGLALGAELNETTGVTYVRVRGEVVARIPAVYVVLEGGIRFALP
jgi:hypothetical protein